MYSGEESVGVASKQALEFAIVVVVEEMVVVVVVVVVVEPKKTFFYIKILRGGGGELTEEKKTVTGTAEQRRRQERYLHIEHPLQEKMGALTWCVASTHKNQRLFFGFFLLARSPSSMPPLGRKQKCSFFYIYIYIYFTPT